MDDATLHLLLPIEAISRWRQIRPWIEKGMEYSDGKINLQRLKDEIEQGTSQVWIVDNQYEIEMVLVSQINQYADTKRLLIFLLAGVNIDKWLIFLKSIEDWARLQGCDAIETYGRKGWERLLKKHAYDFVHVVLRRFL